MSESEPAMGERRRRREAERAASEAAGREPERPLTRRELRAREAALQSGAIEVDSTGELRVVKAPEPTPPAADPLDLPATGTIGLTRRELRALREQQAAAAAQSTEAPRPTTPEPPAPERAAPERPEPERAAPERSTAQRPAPERPTPSAPVQQEPTRPAAAPTPPPRRPVVRPPAAAAGVRALADDGTGLLPVQRPRAEQVEPASPSTWAPEQTGTFSADLVVEMPAAPEKPPTSAQPTIVADPGPLPTTRRTRRVAAEELGKPAQAPTLDAVIAGEVEEPKPFDATPSWAELPPPTPAAPLTAVSPAQKRPSFTEVIAPTGSAHEDDEHDEDGEEDEEDEHRTPRWLTALMILVLIVIGIVLGLLVWQLVTGEGTTNSAADAVGWQGWWT